MALSCEMVAKHLFKVEVSKETSVHGDSCRIDKCSKTQLFKETSLQEDSFKEIFVLGRILSNENLAHDNLILMDFSLFILRKDCVNS